MERWGSDFEGDQRSVFAKIAAKIFSEEREYEFVSDLLHPATIAAIEKFVKDAEGLVVVEIPLLFECGRPEWMDLVVFVSATPEKRVELARIKGMGCS